jgi:predicted dehydrogenase
VQITIVAGHNFPFYRPAYRQIYYARREHGGGAIQDALTHLLNVGEWVVGPIRRIAVDAAHQVLDGIEVEDTVHAITRHAFDDGSAPGALVMGCYSLNQHQGANEITITVVCERGIVRAEYHHNRVRWMSGVNGAWSEQEFPPEERDIAYARQADAFLDAAEGKGDALCSLAAGWQTLRVNLGALASLEDDGRFRTIDEEVPAHERAAALQS